MVFATLKTVFFGSKFLSAPVPSDGTPRRDFVSAPQRTDAALSDHPRCASGSGYPRRPGGSGAGLDFAYRRECAGGHLPLHCVR